MGVKSQTAETLQLLADKVFKTTVHTTRYEFVIYRRRGG